MASEKKAMRKLTTCTPTWSPPSARAGSGATKCQLHEPGLRHLEGEQGHEAVERLEIKHGGPWLVRCGGMGIDEPMCIPNRAMRFSLRQHLVGRAFREDMPLEADDVRGGGRPCRDHG